MSTEPGIRPLPRIGDVRKGRMSVPEGLMGGQAPRLGSSRRWIRTAPSPICSGWRRTQRHQAKRVSASASGPRAGRLLASFTAQTVAERKRPRLGVLPPALGLPECPVRPFLLARQQAGLGADTPAASCRAANTCKGPEGLPVRGGPGAGWAHPVRCSDGNVCLTVWWRNAARTRLVEHARSTLGGSGYDRALCRPPAACHVVR